MTQKSSSDYLTFWFFKTYINCIYFVVLDSEWNEKCIGFNVFLFLCQYPKFQQESMLQPLHAAPFSGSKLQLIGRYFKEIIWKKKNIQKKNEKNGKNTILLKNDFFDIIPSIMIVIFLNKSLLFGKHAKLKIINWDILKSETHLSNWNFLII